MSKGFEGLRLPAFGWLTLSAVLLASGCQSEPAQTTAEAAGERLALPSNNAGALASLIPGTDIVSVPATGGTISVAQLLANDGDVDPTSFELVQNL